MKPKSFSCSYLNDPVQLDIRENSVLVIDQQNIQRLELQYNEIEKMQQTKKPEVIDENTTITLFILTSEQKFKFKFKGKDCIKDIKAARKAIISNQNKYKELLNAKMEEQNQKKKLEQQKLENQAQLPDKVRALILQKNPLIYKMYYECMAASVPYSQFWSQFHNIITDELNSNFQSTPYLSQLLYYIKPNQSSSSNQLQLKFDLDMQKQLFGMHPKLNEIYEAAENKFKGDFNNKLFFECLTNQLFGKENRDDEESELPKYLNKKILEYIDNILKPVKGQEWKTFLDNSEGEDLLHRDVLTFDKKKRFKILCNFEEQGLLGPFECVEPGREQYAPEFLPGSLATSLVTELSNHTELMLIHSKIIEDTRTNPKYASSDADINILRPKSLTDLNIPPIHQKQKYNFAPESQESSEQCVIDKTQWEQSIDQLHQSIYNLTFEETGIKPLEKIINNTVPFSPFQDLGMDIFRKIKIEMTKEMKDYYNFSSKNVIGKNTVEQKKILFNRLREIQQEVQILLYNFWFVVKKNYSKNQSSPWFENSMQQLQFIPQKLENLRMEIFKEIQVARNFDRSNPENPTRAEHAMDTAYSHIKTQIDTALKYVGISPINEYPDMI